MKKKTRERVDTKTGEIKVDTYWDHYVELPSGLDGRRNRRHVQAPTKREALEKAEEIRQEFARDGLIVNPKMLVSELLDIWERFVLPVQKSPNTQASIKLSCRYLKKHLGTIQATALSARHIDAMFESCKLAKASKVKHLARLKQALRWGMKRGHVARNVAELVDTPNGKVAETRALNSDEVERFLRAAKGESQELFCLVLVAFGLRFGEALGLSWDDMDLDEGILYVRRQALRNPETKVTEHVERLKTKSSRRAIALSVPVAEMFKLHLEEQGSASNPRNLVFVSASGGFLDHSNMRRAIQRIADKADVGRVTPNVMRRTACSQLVDDGVSLVRVADLLGHSDTRTTEKHYRKNLRDVEPCAADRSARLVEVLKNSSVGDCSELVDANQIHEQVDVRIIAEAPKQPGSQSRPTVRALG